MVVLVGVATPRLQQAKQPFRARLQVLARLTLNAGKHTANLNRWSAVMPQPNDLSRSLVALDHNSTIIAMVEMSQSSWLASLARRGGQGR